MATRAKRWVGPAPIDKEDDYPLLCARGPDEVNDLMHVAWQTGVLVANKPVITVDGWKRIDSLRARQPNSRQAFVAMWFADEMKGPWERGFKPGVEDSKYYTAFRVDLAEYNERIDDHIVAELRRSGLVVADFTGNRGGVYFEAGFGLGLGVPVIFTCRSDCIDAVHFDTRQYNHIVWDTPEQLRKRLNDRIAATALPPGWRAA
jgi:nucleoside 2-deoxyribosyltransferase